MKQYLYYKCTEVLGVSHVKLFEYNKDCVCVCVWVCVWVWVWVCVWVWVWVWVCVWVWVWVCVPLDTIRRETVFVLQVY